MKVVVAIDSFKGSLSSLQAGSAVREAIQTVDPMAEVFVRPIADGGEGTVDALSALSSAQKITLSVTGPLGAPVDAQYCIIPDKNMAVIEMAAAAGIILVAPEQRDPLKTTTYGVGELIRDALGHGCREFLIGIGGSATNDGGAGMLSALGFRFLDKDGKEIPLGAEGLAQLHSVDATGVNPELSDCKFRVACDVSNPLCGENGCSAIFGPQKGGRPDSIRQMDRWLESYAQLAGTVNPAADRNLPGAGAAGGLGFAFAAFLGATLEPGVAIVLDETELEAYIVDADIVVTGEGRLDRQTVMGKAPIGVAKLAKKYGKKVIAFSGCVADGAEVCNEHGIDAFFPILRQITTLEETLNVQTAYKNLRDTACQVFRLIRL